MLMILKVVIGYFNLLNSVFIDYKSFCIGILFDIFISIVEYKGL